MPDLVIDFVNMTMNTTLSKDKVLPPQFVEVKNAELAESGSFRKRKGINDWTTDNPSASNVNAIAPLYLKTSANITVFAIADNEVWFVTSDGGSWTQEGGGNLTGSVTPHQISWGMFLDTTLKSSLYFSHITTGVIRVGDTDWLKLGGATFTQAACAEYFLNKLFVGKTVESGVTYGNRLRWSITSDDNDWTGTGSGFFPVSLSGSGTVTNASGITGLRVYRDRLWIGTDTTLHVLTGTTSNTFGADYVRTQNFVNGATMYETGGFLWYVDRDGIWQFNGTTAINVVSNNMHDKWVALDDANDILKATASWDDENGIYRVFFPAVVEEWSYYYRTGRWAIRTFNTANNIRVISPPYAHKNVKPSPYFLGTITDGKVYSYPTVVGTTLQDDGNAITASFTTGKLHLGSLAEQPESEAAITDIWVDYVEQAAAAVTLTMDVEVDGTSITQQTITIADAGASDDDFPTQQRMPLPAETLSGRYFEFKFQDATDAVRCDIRKVIIRYELENR